MKKKFFAIFIIFSIFFATFGTGTPAIAQLPQEIRGVWVATVLNIDFPSKQGLDEATLKRELDDIVNTVADNGLNSIFFQVRPTCDALYNSKIFPTSKWLVGKQGDPLPGGFDPLAYLVQKAKSRGIAVHAWINPLRVAYSKTPLVTQLSQNSPALQHPDWVVTFDGKYYFDAGLPEVRSLIAEGVKEIVANYDVAGIVFDDYFYPTEGKKTKFNDNKSFATYGAGFASRGDWRRQNVNSLIKECYEAVKSVRKNCLFGVSPFGIWQNKKDVPNGSDTNGRNAYRDLCCDALAWMKGGYVDYISPQLYWNFSQKNARYDILCRWWNANCDATGTPLVVSHAIYRVAQWQSAKEIANQVSFARQLRSYGGSIFYSYKDLKRNTLGIRDVIRKIMQNSRTGSVSFGTGLTIATPSDNFATKANSLTILGQSNEDSPLFFNGLPVSRTRSGFFCLYTPLTIGKNRLEFEQGGRHVTRNVLRKSCATPHAQDQIVARTEWKEVSIPIQVTKSEARLRPSPNSSVYQDYLPLASGTRDLAISKSEKFYKLRMGGFVAKEDVTPLAEEVPISALTDIAVEDEGQYTKISLARGTKSPIDARVKGSVLIVTLFNTKTNLADFPLPKNPLFKSLVISQDKGNTVLHFKLRSEKNYYGFTVQQIDGKLQILLRNPSTLAVGTMPLMGKKIVLDAGHGGADTGALAPIESLNEKHINMVYILCLKEKLEALGAEVVLTRSADTEFKLLDRANFVRQESPSLSISIHHNSMKPSPRILETGGFVALYTDSASKNLAETITRFVAENVSCRYMDARFQRLAMCRFHAFPSVLLELGFLTSPEDVERAFSPEERENFCNAMAEAILAFYREQGAFCK